MKAVGSGMAGAKETTASQTRHFWVVDLASTVCKKPCKANKIKIIVFAKTPSTAKKSCRHDRHDRSAIPSVRNIDWAL